MENKAISRKFRLLAQLMELHNENPFKIKSIANAAIKIDKLPFPITQKAYHEIDQIDGIGKSIAAKVIELLESGNLKDVDAYLLRTPPGIVEMLGIKGIGPKKIGIIWNELKIDNVGELYYACNENRLVEAKGFGLKTQEEIKKLLEFKMAASGKFLYAQVKSFVEDFRDKMAIWLTKTPQSNALFGIVGAYRRGCEIIEEVEFLIGADTPDLLATLIPQFDDIYFEELEPLHFSAATINGFRIKLSVVERTTFYVEYFKRTGVDEHVDAVLKLAGNGPFWDEESIYQAAGMHFVEPELREGLDELDLARNHQLPSLITDSDLKGSLHNHSDWSDGVHALEQMALYCRDVLKLQYLGISDHSRSAFYAKGLDEQRIYGQHQLIDQLNAKLQGFKIFKGIESDILNDGSLDYSDDILSTFDFIVASIHTNLKMDLEKATARLIKAIENPFTTILGHPTGRLLLSRKGYEIDYKKVIDACAANQVAIEINANPLRLDLDWRWHRYALQKGVVLSINPDAHRMEGFHDTQYGVLVARKGGLTAERCLNAFNLDEISAYFKTKRSAAISMTKS